MATLQPSPATPRSPLRRVVSLLGFLFVLAVLAAVALRTNRLIRKEAADGGAGRYNVLLVTVDTLRADHLGCYGDASAQTPNIDRLAAEGVLFEQAETAAPVTLPSHVSILTGTYPAFHGVRNNGAYRLGPRAETLAEVLRSRGYRTGAVIAGYPLAARFGLSQGFDSYDDALPPERPRQIGFRERKAEEVTRAALAWLEVNGRQRFFLWLHYFDPHAPYDPPSPYADRFSRSPYDGEIAYVDRELGRVVDRLADRRLLGETLVVLVSDHGEGLGEHGEATHGVFLYESTLRVPLILSLPGPLPRGRRVATPIRTIDIMPTILRILEYPAPEEIQGTSLLPLVSRRPPDLLLKSLSESLLPRENYGWSEMGALRIGDWKYVLAPREELYDLRADPGERDNLASRREPDAARMREEIHRLMTDATGSGTPFAYRQELDDAARERLRSLGYLWAPGPQAEGALPDPKDRIALLDGLDAANQMYSRGDFRGAAARLGEVLQSDPGNLTARFHRGRAEVAGGDFDAAQADFEAVLAGRPRNSEVLTNLGSALMGQGLLNEAARTFRQVLELDPDSDKAQAGYGLAMARQGKPEEAAEAFRRALAKNPSSREAQQGLAGVLAATGRPGEAEAALRPAVEADPMDEVSTLALARILYDAARYDEVVALMERSLRAGLESPEIHFVLGNALFRKGESARAGEEYDRVLRADPGHGGALFGLALAALKDGRSGEALRLLERARGADPSNLAARRNLAILYDEAGRDLEAIEEYRMVLRADPASRDLHFHLARVLARTGRNDEAVEEYRAYLAGGGGEFTAQARAEMGRLGAR